MLTSKHIAELRADLKWTQPQLAEAADVDVSTVWRWENKSPPKKGPTKAFLERLREETPGREKAA